MKLLTQADDYGFTQGVTYGILDCIEKGVLKNTGLFVNMPSSVFAASKIKDHPEACFGIDFNLVAGKPVSNPEEVPHLVDENGNFIKSGIHMKNPLFQSEEGRKEQFPYEEVSREIRAQYNRFIELTGQKPGYLHPHSIMPETYIQAIRDLSKETGIPFSMDFQEELGFHSLADYPNPAGMESLKKKEFNPAKQLAKDSFKDFLAHGDDFLKEEYVFAGGHTGYVDAELLEQSTLSLERVRDAQMMLSEEFRKWIEDNNVELVRYTDLYEANVPDQKSDHKGETNMVKQEVRTDVEGLGGGKGTAHLYHILNKDQLGGIGRLYARVVLDPGVSVGWHKHSGETEPYYILSGEGTFIDNDGSRNTVHAGDICTIENNQFHSIENNSDKPLEFMALIYNLI